METETIRDRLRNVTDPDLGDDIVSLNLVNDISIREDTITISLALGAPYSPNETEIADAVRQELATLDREINLTAEMPGQTDTDADSVLPKVKNIITIASGKGGVGKSTIAVNVAAGLSRRGARVGLFDADVYGPNVPRMLDADQYPNATADETLIPPEKFGLKLMSMSFLVGEDDPVIWRGPMVHKIITQLVEDVRWGSLDYLVIDLPPGTGDTQLTILQTIPITGAVIVTTPQEVAIDDARKGLEMFSKHETPVLGITENMSSFVCPDCGNKHAIFGENGGKEFADERDMPFLGEIPLDPAVREGTADGKPIVYDDTSQTGEAFQSLTRNVANNIGILHRKQLQDNNDRT